MSLTQEQLQSALCKYVDPSQINHFRAGDFQNAKVNW
jgi:hypothetical protein